MTGADRVAAPGGRHELVVLVLADVVTPIAVYYGYLRRPGNRELVFA